MVKQSVRIWLLGIEFRHLMKYQNNRIYFISMNYNAVFEGKINAEDR